MCVAQVAKTFLEPVIESEGVGERAVSQSSRATLPIYEARGVLAAVALLWGYHRGRVLA